MNLDEFQFYCHKPHVFSRGALEMTFKAFRRTAPSLALIIQNILSQTPLPKPEGMNDNRHNDYFRIVLTDEDLGDMLSHLANLANQTADQAGNSGQLIMIQTLLQDWLALGKERVEDN